MRRQNNFEGWKKETTYERTGREDRLVYTRTEGNDTVRTRDVYDVTYRVTVYRKGDQTREGADKINERFIRRYEERAGPNLPPALFLD